MTEHRNVLAEIDADRLAAEIATAAAEMQYAPYYHAEEKVPTRIDRARKLVLEHRVWEVAPGLWEVQGSEKLYQINGPCSCPQSERGKSMWCYHKVSVELFTNVCRRLNVQPSRRKPQEETPMPSMAEKRAATRTMLDAKPETPTITDEERTMLTDTTMPAPLCGAPNCLNAGAELIQHRWYCADHAQHGPTSAERALLDKPPLRSIRDIVADLSQPLPKDAIATKKVQSSSISYIHWQTAVRLLDTYAPGWHGQVARLDHLAGHIVIVYRLTIPCLEGDVWREATGCEEEALKGYGDVFSNAEAMAFKRAAAKFGVALDLYDKDATAEALERHLGQGAAPTLSAAEARKRIAVLLHQAGVENTKEAYQQAAQAMTGLALLPQHFGEIVRRLEYQLTAASSAA